MQPKDKFVMELGKPASTKPPPSDSATATSSESNEMTVATPVKATSPTYEMTVSTPIKATSPTSAPQLSIPHVSKCTCTCTHACIYMFYVLLSIHVLVHRMVKMVVAVMMTVAVRVVKMMKSRSIALRISSPSPSMQTQQHKH